MEELEMGKSYEKLKCESNIIYNRAIAVKDDGDYLKNEYNGRSVRVERGNNFIQPLVSVSSCVRRQIVSQA